MPSRTFAIVVSRVYLPPGLAKLWWFADDIQYDHQHKLQKKAPRFFSGRIHAPADSFISKNEGMNELGYGKGANVPITSNYTCRDSSCRRHHGCNWPDHSRTNAWSTWASHNSGKQRHRSWLHRCRTSRTRV